MPAVELEENAIFTFPECAFTAPENKEFELWRVGSDSYYIGDTMKITGSVTAVAQWADIETFTVTFDAQGHGTAPSPVVVLRNGTLSKTDLYESGWTFEGWFKEAACENEWNFENDIVTQNMTLYAKWSIIPQEITEVHVTAQIPSEGEIAAGSSGEENQYTWSAEWYDISEGTDGYLPSYIGNEFTKGHEYKLSILVRPKYGYRFSNTSVQTVTLNGEEIGSESYWLSTQFNADGDFYISKRYYLLAEDDVVPKKSAVTYTGSAIKPGVTVTTSGGEVVSSENYEIVYSNNVNVGTATMTITGKGNYIGTVEKTFTISPAKVTAQSGKTLTYNGKAQTGVAACANYTVTNGSKTNAGTYTATLSLKDKANYTWSDGTTADKSVKWTINKAANPLKISAKTATVKYSKVKKKAQTLAVTKVMTFTKDVKDKKTYTLSSAKKGSKSFKKYFKINKTTGKVTVKKGLRKGTYKVTVKVKAAGNANYKASAQKTVTFKIKVK